MKPDVAFDSEVANKIWARSDFWISATESKLVGFELL